MQKTEVRKRRELKLGEKTKKKVKVKVRKTKKKTKTKVELKVEVSSFVRAGTVGPVALHFFYRSGLRPHPKSGDPETAPLEKNHKR